MTSDTPARRLKAGLHECRLFRQSGSAEFALVECFCEPLAARRIRKEQWRHSAEPHAEFTEPRTDAIIKALTTHPFLELLPVIEAEIQHLGKDSKESLFSLVGWYVDQDAFLGVVVADVHLKALPTAVDDADRVVDHIVIYQLGLARSYEAEAGLSSRSEMAPVGFVGTRNSRARGGRSSLRPGRVTEPAKKHECVQRGCEKGLAGYLHCSVVRRYSARAQIPGPSRDRDTMLRDVVLIHTRVKKVETRWGVA
jgi:hypothetical protein